MGEGAAARTVHFPRSCLHCEEPACVTVCPTGASYKRAEDGIVLVNDDICIGCKLCSWACPYGAREFDADEGVMKKCTLCIDRIYNENLAPEERAAGLRHGLPDQARGISAISATRIRAVSRAGRERGGDDLMPELGYRPVNKYLPPRRNRMAPDFAAADAEPHPVHRRPAACLRWVDRLLSRMMQSVPVTRRTGCARRHPLPQCGRGVCCLQSRPLPHAGEPPHDAGRFGGTRLPN